MKRFLFTICAFTFLLPEATGEQWTGSKAAASPPARKTRPATKDKKEAEEKDKDGSVKPAAPAPDGRPRPAATPEPAPAAGTSSPAPSAKPPEPAPATGTPSPDPGIPGPAAAARPPAPTRPSPTRPYPSASSGKPVNHYDQLRKIGEMISKLKEMLAIRKREVDLLKNAVLHGTKGAAQLKLKHVNKMGSSFRLVSMQYELDGKVIFVRRELSETRMGRPGTSAEIYNGPVMPGKHTLTVVLKWRGHGYGVYSYLKGYRFEVLSRYSFEVGSGTSVSIEAVAYERPKAPLKQRPAIRFQKGSEKKAAAHKKTTKKK